MLVEGDAVEAHLLGEAVLVEVVVVVLGSLDVVEVAIGHGEEGPVAQDLVFVDVSIRTFGEVSDVHRVLLYRPMKAETAETKAAESSISGRCPTPGMVRVVTLGRARW